MSASTAYRPVHGGFPGEPHVHVYEPVIRRHATAAVSSGAFGFMESIEGYRCECGKPRPMPGVLENARAAAEYMMRRYGGSGLREWEAARNDLLRGYAEVRAAWERYGR